MTGAICIDKSSGMTSFTVCKKLSKLFEEKKCGHTGTLDPLATGLMIVLFGGATRFSQFIADEDKHYVAKFILGKATDTYDITGTITEEQCVNVSKDDVERALNNFRGSISQEPPMYSAISLNGERLYKLARAGEVVEREKRQIFIKSLSIISYENNEYTIDTVCSKGTYIRSLINDIGQALGCGAVMTSLRRLGYAGLSLQDSVTLEDLFKEKENSKDISKHIVPIDKLLQEESVYITEKQSVRFKNGGALDINRVQYNIQEGQQYKVYSPTNEFLGLGKVEDGEIKVRKLLVNK